MRSFKRQRPEGPRGNRAQSWAIRATRFLEDLTGLVEAAVCCTRAFGRLTRSIAWTLAGVCLILAVLKGL
jgi:uncharacterized membrane protein YphA (DoxX/SURF4 family)